MIDAYIENSQIVLNASDQILVGDVAVDTSQMTQYTYSLHEGYSDMNNFEKKIAASIDKTKKTWFRNPARGVFEIPLLDKGGTKNFYPAFVVWSGNDVFAIDTKGDHLIKEDSSRKLFIASDGSRGGSGLFIRLITEGKWNQEIMKESQERLVWINKQGKIHPLHVKNTDDAVQAALRKY